MKPGGPIVTAVDLARKKPLVPESRGLYKAVAFRVHEGSVSVTDAHVTPRSTGRSAFAGSHFPLGTPDFSEVVSRQTSSERIKKRGRSRREPASAGRSGFARSAFELSRRREFLSSTLRNHVHVSEHPTLEVRQHCADDEERARVRKVNDLHAILQRRRSWRYRRIRRS